ncbi:hypothetical protein QR680_008707 [Steinernema hermaphroditum]|uniref:Uncharacterized protein n=1 Tax=Steinernema hermaphroditum TaxID=289476 RepID=A0AA39M7H9_9BILA|nr:hypothetical protein QR680_008707 [Steinernema hermaphroditum]
MASIKDLSRAPTDLLAEKDKCFSFNTVDDKAALSRVAGKKNLEAPEAVTNAVPHELLAEHSRMERKISDFVEERRTIAGTAHTETIISELHAASQITRGPPGFSAGSQLHFDLLTGRDERIDFGDYLNVENDLKW